MNSGTLLCSPYMVILQAKGGGDPVEVTVKESGEEVALLYKEFRKNVRE